MEPQFGDKYVLEWLAAKPGLVARVRNFTVDDSRYREIPVYLDENEIQRARMRLLALTYDRDRNPKIIVGNALMALPRAMRTAAVWHEVGHVHFEHTFIPEHNTSSDAYRLARMKALRDGGVISTETEADDFAAARVGAGALLKFLRHTLRTRPTGAGLNDLGGLELERRATHLEHMGG